MDEGLGGRGTPHCWCPTDNPVPPQRNKTGKSSAALSYSPAYSPVNLSSCPYRSLLPPQLCAPSVKQQVDLWPQHPRPGLPPHITLIPGAEEVGETWSSATVHGSLSCLSWSKLQDYETHHIHEQTGCWFSSPAEATHLDSVTRFQPVPEAVQPGRASLPVLYAASRATGGLAQ